MVKPTHQRGLVPYPDQETINMIRTPKAAALLFAVTIPLLFAASCTPEEIALYGTMNADEQAAVTAHLQAQAEPEPPAHNPPSGFLACVRRHESGGNYQAENPVSTASGAYQFLDSTWRTMSARAGHSGWGHAASAPPAVQDAVAQYTVNSGWSSAWNGTGC
jgi:hypothetical protein